MPENQNKTPFVLLVTIFVLILAGVGVYYYQHYVKNNKSEKSHSGTEEVKNQTDRKEDELFSQQPTGLDPKEEVKTVGDVEKVVAKWVEANPQMIIRAVINMQNKLREQQEKEAQKVVVEKADEIFNSEDSPVYAPKGYDITVVEFFDYNCGHCRRAQAVVSSLLKEDKKIRLIFKEYPILGPSSEELASVALAVNMVSPADYQEFHNKLMHSNVKNAEEALKLAKSLSINSDKVKEILKDKKEEIGAIIQNNRELGMSLGVNGTPAFIIGEEVVRGALELNVLKAKIKQQREKKNQ